MDNTQQMQQQIDSLTQRVSDLEKIVKVALSNPLPVKEAKKISLKEFLLTKNLTDDVKKTLAIGYFLDKYEGQASLNTDDLSDAFEKAKEKKPKNINDKVNMNIKNGHMAEASEKKNSKKAWYITTSGEKFVEEHLAKGDES